MRNPISNAALELALSKTVTADSNGSAELTAFGSARDHVSAVFDSTMGDASTIVMLTSSGGRFYATMRHLGGELRAETEELQDENLDSLLSKVGISCYAFYRRDLSATLNG